MASAAGPSISDVGHSDVEQHPHLLVSTNQQPSSQGSRASQRHQTSDSEFEAKKLLFKAGERLVPLEDEEKKGRLGFSSQFQYLLSVIGMSVGLGNIWRFPGLAYEFGGGAFLIPYLCMGLFFGLPMIFLDSSIGQFMQNSPSIVFKQYFPAAQGLGWTMALIVLSIGFFYNLPCAWSLIYIVQLICGRMKYLMSCVNEWNTILCDRTVEESTKYCNSTANLVYFNGTCMSAVERTMAFAAANITLQSAPEEFFYFHIVQKHASFSFGHLNWMIALSLFVCWSIVAAGLLKGVQSMGQVALVTTILPYGIITILFFRGITLEGASVGIRYFLTNPQWDKIANLKTWSAALSQSLFSLSIGGGSMIMMASYNKRDHPNYRDCLIIFAADTFMSVLGGSAVFAILGSMATRMNIPIEKVISAPLTLTFIAYPEATTHMWAPTLWALLFFFMMFILGISTMFAFVEGFTTCLIDEQPKLAKKRWLIVSSICGVCFLLNIVCFAFQNGFHFFNILNEFLGTVSLSGSLVLELIILMTYYGAPRIFRDIQCMHGLPTTTFHRIFGSLGIYVKFAATITAPCLTVWIAYSITTGFVKMQRLKDRINSVDFLYPTWVVPVGFMIGAIPLFLVPAGAIMNYLKMRKNGEPTADLFRITDDHPSVRYNLPDPVSWKEFLWPPLKNKMLADSANPQGSDPTIPTIPSSTKVAAPTAATAATQPPSP